MEGPLARMAAETWVRDVVAGKVVASMGANGRVGFAIRVGNRGPADRSVASKGVETGDALGAMKERQRDASRELATKIDDWRNETAKYREFVQDAEARFAEIMRSKNDLDKRSSELQRKRNPFMDDGTVMKKCRQI